MRGLLSTVIVPLALCSFGCAAGAEEYCVTCTEPAAKYRCVVDAPNPHAERGQLLCITELAQSGNHLSCSVGATTSGPCAGNLRTVTMPADATVAPPPLAEAVAPAAGPAPVYSPPPVYSQAESAAAPPPGGAEPASAEGPPKTVEELAKNTVKASGDGIKQAGKAVTDTAQSAGNAVGTAVKKTWTCLSSFFGDC